LGLVALQLPASKEARMSTDERGQELHLVLLR
jgi:hypothetical protein